MEKTLTFDVSITGDRKFLDDVTAFEVCEAIRKALGEVSVRVKETTKEKEG